ncbi:TATA-binding protein-associated factor [Dirofilaria immitis]
MPASLRVGHKWEEAVVFVSSGVRNSWDLSSTDRIRILLRKDGVEKVNLFVWCKAPQKKMEKQANRTERLGALLSSRNALVRREAAQALGHFPLTNPYVIDILKNNFQANAWDTREAAVEAFRAILKAMPFKSQVISPRIDSISRLNLRDTVRTYHPLLSCEAELVTRMGVCSFGEQRKLVDEQLDFQSVIGISSGTFLSEDDFSSSGNVKETTPERKLDLVATTDTIGCDDSLEELDAAIYSVCIRLMRDVVDVKWEIRHGAALAIACILTVAPSRLSPSLVDVLATRLFQTIALDKFIDFSSGRTAVGPVREAVAECIARLTMVFPSSGFVDIIFDHIYMLHKMTDGIQAECYNANDLESHKRTWFHRQAALLIIKYHLAGPYYDVKFNEVFRLLLCSFEDSHDEVCASALSAITTLFCKDDLKPEVSEMISHVEHVIYRFIDSTCNVSRNQLLDIDTVAVDLLSLLAIWLQGDSSRKLPYPVSSNLSYLLDPLHITLSLKVVNVFSVSFSRPSPLKDENEYKEFETCIMSVLASLFHTVLFAAPQDTEDLIEACILCVHRIVEYFVFVKHLPQALVETIGRWTACLLIDARNAEIDLEKCNVRSDASRNSTECLCGDEIRSLSDMIRIDVVLTRKLHVARFLAPLISAIYNFPSRIGNQLLSEAVQLLITPTMKSLLIMHRLGGVLLSHAWFTYVWRSGITIDIPSYVAEVLHGLIMSPNAAYDDEKMFFLYLDNAYKDFASYCRMKGVSATEIFDVEGHGYTVDNNASALYDICHNILREASDRETLRLRYDSFKYAVATAKAVMTSNISRVNALIVSSLLLIYPRSLLDSPSLNPFVKPLMELIRFEENVTLAQYALNSIPILFRIASEKQPSPHAKMIKQIVMSLVSCPNRFPQEIDREEDVVLSQSVKRPFSSRSRNAEYVIRMLVTPIAGTDMASLLDFRNHSSLKEAAMFMMAYTVFIDESRIQRLIPPHLSDIILELGVYLTSENAVARYCAAQCLSNIARIDGFLRPVLQTVAPLQRKLRTGETRAHVRCGLVELLFLLSGFHVEMLGGLRLLAPISLRLMADNSQVVREAAAVSFRNFVPLMTLKANRRVEEQSLRENDVADEIFGDNSLDLLLGDPSRLPELRLTDIKGLSASTCLRHYQQEGIRWMSFLEEFGLSGILADDMGLGKTLQTLCLLAMKIYRKPQAKVLIVCPPTLVNHWCAEWSKFFPTLSPFYKIEEGCREKKLLMDNSQKVTVISYNTVRFCTYVQDVEWYYMILDEGHMIRNPTTQLFKTLTNIKAQNRLILSGTPVQNTPADLWALFQFLMPGYLGTMKQFKLAFLNAINGSRNINASAQEIKEGQDALERLHKSILPFVMRRLKTDVLEDLPEKIVQDYMCSMTTVQRFVYNHIVDMYQSARRTSTNRPTFCALETIAELRKCTVHPCLVSQKSLKDLDIDKLQGCVEESGKIIALRELLKECGIGSREHYTLSEESAVQDSEISETGNGHRALIFCQRLSAVQLLVNLFSSGELGSDIRYAVLDGTIPINERYAIAEKFNVDPSIHLLILTTNIGGEGLNLIGADIVIFLEHDWNPVKDLQAMDRAHRIGQRCAVNVYRLITEGSIEQKIMRLQKFKTDTANALVGADNRSLQTMATEQLMELFVIDDVLPGTSLDVRSSKKSYESNTFSVSDKHSTSSDIGEKLNIEELWELSQYDRYHASSIAHSFELPTRNDNSSTLVSDASSSSNSGVVSGSSECKKLRLDD